MVYKLEGGVAPLGKCWRCTPWQILAGPNVWLVARNTAAERQCATDSALCRHYEVRRQWHHCWSTGSQLEHTQFDEGAPQLARLAPERPLACDKLPQHNAKREDLQGMQTESAVH